RGGGRARTHGHPRAPAIAALDPHARRLTAFGIEQHHVGDVYRALALDHAADRLLAIGVAHLLGTHVAFDHVQTLDVHAFPTWVRAHDAAALAAILAGDHEHLVARANLHSGSS